jgi:hypothetical protein
MENRMSLDYILNFPSKSAGLFAPADCATSSTPAKFLEYEPRENKKRKPSLQCRTQGCAAEFSRKSQLLYHKINIHRDVPLSASGAFMCHACKFAFIRKGDLVSNYPLHRMPPIDFFHLRIPCSVAGLLTFQIRPNRLVCMLLLRTNMVNACT